MTVYNRGTEGRLNDIMSTLGTTKASLWPFWESQGSLVTGISVGDLTSSDEAAARTLESEFAPLQLPCGLFSYHFQPSGNQHLAGIEHANYTFGTGAADAAFSVGAWIRPSAIATNVIMGKYDTVGLNAEEWRFLIDSNGKLSLELMDASVPATEIAVSTSAMTLGQWVWAVATYDGTETAPVVNLYVDGILANDGSTTETGAYVAMEDTATPLTIGCSGTTGTPAGEFHGRLALPFVTGKELSAAEVATLYKLMTPMVGLA